MFYMPVNFGAVMTRMNKLVGKNNAQIPDWLCLSDHTSKWNMNLYLAVDKAILGAENVLLSGTFTVGFMKVILNKQKNGVRILRNMQP